jgi:integrase
VLKAFLDFARIENSAVERFTFPDVSVFKDRKVPEYYESKEIGLMLAQIDRANPRGKRDYAMILIGARYGLRISDIKNLKLSDIDFVSNKISIVQVKTGRSLMLDLLPDVGWAIIDYLKNGRPQTETSTVFVRHVAPYDSFGTHDNLAHIIGKYATAAGVKGGAKSKSSFHMLRYGLASELLKQDVSLTTISGILGHSELNVTTLYTKIDVPQLIVCALEVPV